MVHLSKCVVAPWDDQDNSKFGLYRLQIAIETEARRNYCNISHQEEQMIVDQIPSHLLQEILYWRHEIQLFRIYFVARVDLNGVVNTCGGGCW